MLKKSSCHFSISILKNNFSKPVVILLLVLLSFASKAQQKQDSTILRENSFFQGDSLSGFDVVLEYHKIASNLNYNHDVVGRLYHEESNFIQTKYHPLKNRNHTINPNNYKTLSSTCDNLDFEDGNCTGWVGFIGYNSNSNAPLTTTATGIFNGAVDNPEPSCNYHTIVDAAAGNDPYGGFPMLDAGGGSYALRLGGEYINEYNGNSPGNVIVCAGGNNYNSGGEIIQQTFLVTPANALITYNYAVVLNAAPHNVGQQPYFLAEILDSLGNPLPCCQYYIQILKNVVPPGFILSSGTNYYDNSAVYYLPWTSNSFNLNAYIGHKVTLYFAAAGCIEGGHFGYGYVDASCSPVQLIKTTSSTCGGSVTLTAPAGDSAYAWTQIPAGSGISGSAAGQSVTVTQSGTYQVTVTQRLGCTYVVDSTIVITSTPTITVNSGNICPGSSMVLTSTGAGVGGTYSWTPAVGLSATTGASVTANPATTTSYTVTGTSTAGCTGSAIATVTINPSLTVTVNSGNICPGSSMILTSTGAGVGGTYSWTPAVGLSATTGASVTANPATTTSYTVTGTSTSGCTGSAIATVTINPLPNIGVNSLTICTGSSGTLTATGGTTYSWTPGTGLSTTTGTSVTANPSATTTYTVTGTDANGCTNTAATTVTVNPAPTVTVNSPSICPTSSAPLTASGAVTYAWAPATGLSATTGTTVTASPAATTDYTVTGTDANGCTNTAIATVTVINVLTVTVNSGAICLGSNMTLTGAGAATYAWAPATGLSATTGTTVTANPTVTTTYTVTGTSIAGCTGSAIATVTVNPPPTVGVNSPSICTGTSSPLTGTGAVTYTWTPAAGLSATTGTTVTANPTVTTTYTVTGTDVNGCTNTAVATVTINPLPTPNFTSTSVCFNNVSAFTDASTTTVGTITAWSWNFGEPSSGANNTSATQNPTHTYGSSGTFNVTLIATNSTGCIDSVKLPVVVNPLPLAAFTSSPVCMGTATDFTDGSTISSGTITGWAWNFGDPGSGVNNTSTTQSPNHTYSAAGSYTVTLTVTSNNGCQGTITQTVTVNPIPVAAFTATSVCVSDVMNFTDASTVAPGTITGWSWNFGDGGTAITQNPTHTYGTSGTFTVTLTVTSNGGCTNTVTNTVTVFPAPVAAFTATNVCLQNTTTFTDASTVSSGTVTSWAWNFGDGNTSAIQNPTHVYVASGSYTVKLTATSSNGCSNTISENVIVYPIPVAAFSNTTVCQNSPTSFTDGSTISSGSITNWLWNFGDGTSSTIESPMHLYAKDSTYIVKLIVTSSNGCVDSITQNVTVNPNPVVAFTVNDSIGCAPLCVQFTDHSTIANGGTINNWLWSYGDGNTGNTEDPSHCYTVAGTYDVALTVTSQSNCSTTLTHPHMITVYPVPEAAFTMNPNPTTIANPTINFVDGSTGASAWHWDFGDGDTLTWGANDNNATHTYGDTGVFNIQLIVINQFGCTDSVMHPIYIEPTFTFYAPNAFTPNGDGKNDYFFGTGTGIRTYQMWIFDRWGNLIYHTNDLNGKWDGIVAGGNRMAQIDVYVWKVNLTDVFNKTHQYIGHVSLVK